MDYYYLVLEIQLPESRPKTTASDRIPKWPDRVCLYQTLLAGDFTEAMAIAHTSFQDFCQANDLTDAKIYRIELSLVPSDEIAYYERCSHEKSAGVVEYEEIEIARKEPDPGWQACGLFLLIIGTLGFFLSALLSKAPWPAFFCGAFVAMAVFGVVLNCRTKRKSAPKIPHRMLSDTGENMQKTGD